MERKIKYVDFDRIKPYTKEESRAIGEFSFSLARLKECTEEDRPIIWSLHIGIVNKCLDLGLVQELIGIHKRFEELYGKKN